MEDELRVRRLKGLDYLNAATELLLKARSESEAGSFYQAADIQWWWREEAYLKSREYTFWYNASGEPVACLLLMAASNRCDGDLLWRSSYTLQTREQVWPFAIDRLYKFARDSGEVVRFLASGQCLEFVDYVQSRGFISSPSEDIVQFSYHGSPIGTPAVVPSGLAFLDNSTIPPRQHHLSSVSRPNIGQRLAECSLYDPTTDMYVVNSENRVVGYCLAWYDKFNCSALFEPLFVDRAFRRSGLGTLLLSEGIRRLHKKNCKSIVISCDAVNLNAATLYMALGFRPQFRKLRFLVR